MIDIALDFESYYDSEYSLKKLNNAEYVMDPKFESMGFSIKIGGKPTQWVSGDFQYQHRILSQVPWDRVRLIAHNARFDGSILEWKFKLRPHSYLCTMVGSRPHLVPKTGSMSLEAVSNYLGLPPKGQTVHLMTGKHRGDLSQQELADYGAYCTRDTENAWSIAQELIKILPEDELTLIDLTLKKYLRPVLKLDGKKLVARIEEMKIERSTLLNNIHGKYGVTKQMLSSRPQFAAVLESYGVTVPMKAPSPKTKKQEPTYAFAKDDLEFKALLVHSDPRVRELCAAKLTVSSSQEQSRLGRLLSLHNVMNGNLPVPLVYYGAHPGRFSGDEKINLQNLQRVSRDKQGKLIKGHLRYCVVARPGYTLIAADFKNIEARIVATLAGQEDLVKGFKNNEDVYSAFASDIYGYQVNQAQFPQERFVGKTCVLGLNYGLGYLKFLLKMQQEGVDMTEREAKRIVYLYRDRYPKIKTLRETLDTLAFKYLINPGSLHIWKDLTWMHERILLPNGMPICYPDIAWSKTENSLYYRSRKYQALADNQLSLESGTKIWGGTFLENIAQALARIIATRAELKLTKIGLPVVLQAHDELVFQVPDCIVQAAIVAINQVMTEPVEWLPELPIAVDIKHGPSYGECK
jgi:DNA polymerase